MKHSTDLTRQAEIFLEKSFCALKKNNIVLDDHWHIDHLCYRTTSEQNYLRTKNIFADLGYLLIESEVNGRLIATYKLHKPICYQDWDIDLIEVPAPKKGKSVSEGYEHFEIVCDLTFDQIKNKYPYQNYDESGLVKNFNQEFEIIFDDFAIKFHHLSLESVINLEKNSRVYSALIKSQILDLLKPFSPLIAGTFPLGIDHSKSDVDIIVSSSNLNDIKKLLLSVSKNFSNFSFEQDQKNNQSYVFCSFIFEQVAFEIFGQELASLQQQAYRHFLIEERLLKLGGSPLREKIMQLRQAGLKTEPAFATTLGLHGDAFNEILKLQSRSNKYLKSIL